MNSCSFGAARMDMLQSTVSELTSNPALLKSLLIFSIMFFIAGLVSVPFLVCKIPNNYFLRGKRSWSSSYEKYGIAFILILLLKNSLAIILFIAGIFMLFLPGQGLLSLFLGIMLLDFPRKYQLESWLIRKPALNKSLNWIRRKNGIEEILLP